MTGRRQVSLSGSIELNVDRLVAEIVAGVLAGLADPGTGRHTEVVSPEEMPPRGTVRWSDPGEEGGQR